LYVPDAAGVVHGEIIPLSMNGRRPYGQVKETRMTVPAAEYDHIGSKYDEYARTATLKRAERHTFLRIVGPPDGTRVLDLACGFGF
jgi:hypothetical protein